MNNKKAKAVFIISAVVCILALVAMVFFSAHRKDDSKKNKSNVESLRESAVSELDSAPGGITVDFEALQKENPDIYAWISIPGTVIDYPIVQAWEEDDFFYLNHGIDKNPNINGSIYTEKHNSLDFTDPNTVIYGHNMRDGSMFAELHKFSNQKFFDAHPYIYIYTPERTLTYTIVSAYKSDARHILNAYDFSKPKVFEEYLEKVTNPRYRPPEPRVRKTELTTEDKLITLSTCIGDEKDYRYLVQGVLTNDQPR